MTAAQIRTIKDLDRIKTSYNQKLQAYKYQVLVCGGSGCQSAKCGQAKEALQKLIETHYLQNEVVVIETGCMGLCTFGPVILIMPDEILYTEVNSEKITEIFQTHIVEGQIKEEYTYYDCEQDKYIPKIQNIRSLKQQTRMALKNCGRVDHSSIEAYIALGGYYAAFQALQGMSSEAIVQEVKKSALKGRGNNGLSVGELWEAGKKAEANQRYIICNADDGDPNADMNRCIIEGNPHVVIEGMILAGYAIGATKGYIYVNPEYPLACQRLIKAVEQAQYHGLLGNNILGKDMEFNVEVFVGAGSFVCREDTSLIAAIQGKRGEAENKPPYPFECGLNGQPTVIHNADTFASIPFLILQSHQPKTIMFSLSGDLVNKGTVEVPLGMSLGDLVYDVGGGLRNGKSLKAVQVGGPCGQLIAKGTLNTPIDYDSFAMLHTMMSSAGLSVMSEDTCMVDMARKYMEFIQAQSCGKCAPCRVGTKRLLEILERITQGNGRAEDLVLLEEISQSLKESAVCSLGENAPNIILNTLNYFKEEYVEHIDRKYCQAGVCSELVLSPCQNACPAAINVPGYMALISEGRYHDAYHLMRRENPFPAVCGRICTRPCESKCRRAQLDEPIAIADLKRFVSDCAFELDNPLREETPVQSKGKSIGIIGAGPSGLTCGYYLARLGYDVDVYESQTIAGGVLAYGIPEYRLPNAILTREINLIEQAGVKIHLNTEIGKDVSFQELKNKHHAIYVATGSQIANKIDVPGEDLPGVIPGLDFLRQVNLGQEVQVGNVVAVIGGGNTAIDAARTALRMGAQKVMLLYRRTLEDMPADVREIQEAIEEGIQIMPLTAPVRLIGTDRIQEIECVQMELGLFDAGGRKRPKAKAGSNFTIQVDTVIPAVSQSSEVSFIPGHLLCLTEWGTIVTDKNTRMSTMEGVFAGGDITRGPDVAIHAIADGKQAAISIDLYLGGQGVLNKGAEVEYPPASDEDALHEHERYEMEILAPHTRKGSFVEVGVGYHKLKAIAESMRCLRCDRR